MEMNKTDEKNEKAHVGNDTNLFQEFLYEFHLNVVKVWIQTRKDDENSNVTEYNFSSPEKPNNKSCLFNAHITQGNAYLSSRQQFSKGWLFFSQCCGLLL